MKSTAVDSSARLAEPRIANVPEFRNSRGTEVCELMEAAGRPMDPWQSLSLHYLLGERPSIAKWACFEFGVLVARQNGKGDILMGREVGGLFLFGEKLILHSAHEFKTAREAFLRLKELIDNNDFLRKRVAKMPTAHGEEGVELLPKYGGSRLRFVARSKSSGRGFSGNTNILDEAQELPSTAVDALMPTMRAMPNPQIIYTGTVPAAENNAEHWTTVRNRGRAGTSRRLGWLEWSPEPVEEGEEYDLDDRAIWWATNPAMGIRISEEGMADERDALSDEGFARELLSIWDDTTVKKLVPLDLWDKLADASAEFDSRVAFAIDMPPDRGEVDISAAGRSQDRWMVEVLRHEDGRLDSLPTWKVPARLVQLYKQHNPVAIVVDPGSPAGALIPDIKEAFKEAGIDFELTEVGVREIGQACGAFVDKVTERGEDGQPTLGFTHRADPRLRTAMETVKKRKLGDSGAFGLDRRDPTINIAPLVSAVFALHGAMTNDVEDVPNFW